MFEFAARGGGWHFCKASLAFFLVKISLYDAMDLVSSCLVIFVNIFLIFRKENCCEMKIAAGLSKVVTDRGNERVKMLV